MKKIISVLSTSLICSSAFAGSSDAWLRNTWVSFEAGAAFWQEPNNMATYDMPGVNLPDNYINNEINNSALLGVGLGYSFVLNDDSLWFPANHIGMYYDYYFQASESGYIEKWQSIEAYTYKFHVNSNTLWIGDQLDLFIWENIIPFVEAGIGVAWNRASGYEETPVPDNPQQDQRDQSAAFSDRTTTEFAWRVGAGINILLPCDCEEWVISALYRYADLGHVKTDGSENYSTLDSGLETKLQSNEILGRIRYYF